MAAQSRKQTLITELDAVRAHIAGDMVVIAQDLDFRARVKSHYARHPAFWFGTAGIVGMLLSRLVPSRGKAGAPRCNQAGTTGKAPLLFTLARLTLSLAKPAIMQFLAGTISNQHKHHETENKEAREGHRTRFGRVR
jgi:hypothetical protein